MTQNQIRYAELQESKRHNLATEEAGFQNASANLSQASSAAVNASTRRDELKETIRANNLLEAAKERDAQIKLMESDREYQLGTSRNKIQSKANEQNYTVGLISSGVKVIDTVASVGKLIAAGG